MLWVCLLLSSEVRGDSVKPFIHSWLCPMWARRGNCKWLPGPSVTAGVSLCRSFPIPTGSDLTFIILVLDLNRSSISHSALWLDSGLVAAISLVIHICDNLLPLQVFWGPYCSRKISQASHWTTDPVASTLYHIPPPARVAQKCFWWWWHDLLATKCNV